jgi:hypothetical protein
MNRSESLTQNDNKKAVGQEWPRIDTNEKQKKLTPVIREDSCDSWTRSWSRGS